MTNTTRTSTGLLNVHSRATPGTMERAAEALACVAGPEDRLWPSDRWPPIRFDQGLAVGSTGGHGPIRYRVTALHPHRARFDFTSPRLRGHHEFELTAEDPGVRWTHRLVIHQPSLAQRLVVVPLHDALLEDLLDNATALMTGRSATSRQPLPRRTRALRWLLSRATRAREARS